MNGAWLMMLLLVTPGAGLDARAKAREFFESGAESLATGRFVEAAKAFEQCLELADIPPCAFNLAVAQRGTGDALAAERVLEGLLTGEWGRLEPARRRQVQQLLRQTRAQIAQLELRISPETASTLIRLDGEVVRTLGHALRLNPGEHVMLVTADGFYDVERKLTLTPGESRELSLTLELLPEMTVGTLIVETPSATDRVEVEGVGVSVGGYEAELDAGVYRVRVSRDGERREREVKVEAGATLRVAIDVRESGSSIVRNPWFWAGTALVVAGSVGAVLFFTREEAPPVIRDEVFDVTEALQPRFEHLD